MGGVFRLSNRPLQIAMFEEISTIDLLVLFSLNGRDPSLFSYLPSSVCCFSLCFRNGPDVDISFNNVSHISEASPLVDVGNFRTILPEIKLEVSISSIIPVSSLAQQMDGKHTELLTLLTLSQSW